MEIRALLITLTDATSDLPPTWCTLETLLRLNGLHHGCADHDTEGKRFKSPIHCCDVTKPPYLFSGELCIFSLHSERLFVYTVCCRRTCQCFSVLRTRKSDVIVTQWTAVVGEVTSPSSDTMCHFCAPVVYTMTKLRIVYTSIFDNLHVSILKRIIFRVSELSCIVVVDAHLRRKSHQFLVLLNFEIVTLIARIL